MNHHQEQPLRVSSQAERESLLRRCWMTHDAMWFFHCAQACGMDTTNKINKAAVRSMAQIEIQRIKQALGIDKVDTFAQLVALLEATFDLMKADFMAFTWRISAENTLRWDMQRCFAYEGVRKLGVADQYQCGIFERMEGWAEGLGLEHTVTPQVQGCMMHTDGKCFRELRFRFPAR